MRPIIAATDFSPISKNSVQYAADMAVAASADLYILHVVKVYSLLPEVAWPPEAFEITESEAKAELKIIKDTVEASTNNKITVFTKLEPGDFRSNLARLCDEVNPMMVVIGVTGDPVKRFLDGSHTLTATQLSVPILIVPPSSSFHNLKKIVIACDLERLNNKFPTAYFKELKTIFDTEIHILYVHKDGWPLEKAEPFKERLKDIQPKFHFISERNVEEGIHKFLAAHEVDLLLLFPQTHYFPMNLFIKHHSKEIILHEHVPIMTIHE